MREDEHREGRTSTDEGGRAQRKEDGHIEGGRALRREVEHRRGTTST